MHVRRLHLCHNRFEQTPFLSLKRTGHCQLQQRHLLDLKQIKQIIELMKRSELTEFAVEEEGFKLKIRRGTGGLPIITPGRGSNPPFPGGESAPPLPSAMPPAAAAGPASGGSNAPKEEPGVTYVK